MPNQDNPDSKILWVIEGGDCEPKRLQGHIRAGSLSPNIDIDILWMSDCGHTEFHNWLIAQGYRANLLMAGSLLQQEMAGFAGELEIWSEAIFQDNVGSHDIWRSPLTEFNFSQRLWFDLVRLNVLTKHLRRDTYNACFAFGRGEFVSLCEQVCDKRNIEFQGISLSSGGSFGLSMLARGIYRWLLNLTSEIITLVVLSGSTRTEKNVDRLIYAQYPQNWSRNGKQISNRFVGKLSAVSDGDASSKQYLISLLRGDQSKLKTAAQVFPALSDLQNTILDLGHDIVERYGDLKSILKAYFSFGSGFRWLARWRGLLRSDTLLWQGITLNKFLWGIGINAILVDWPKNRYLETCVANALKEKGAESLLVPIFELVEGRSVVRAGKRAGVKVVGIQHGAIGLAHRWRVVLPQGLMKRHGGEEYQPDIIAVEGEVAQGWLKEAGIEDEKVEVIGAPRVTADVPLANLKEMSRTILVLGEYHRPEVLFDWCTKHLLNAGYEVVFRPHPTHYKKAEAWLGEQEDDVREHISMSPLGESLAEDLMRLKPVCVLASVTGAMVEVALSGWPVGVIISNWLPDYAPLTAIEGTEVFSSNDPGDVKAWIERLLDDEAYRAAYSHACKEAARQHLAMIKEDAASALADIL